LDGVISKDTIIGLSMGGVVLANEIAKKLIYH